MLSDNDQSRIAAEHYLDDVPEAAVTGSQLRLILEALQEDHAITSCQATFLDERNFQALLRLAHGETSREEFRQEAQAEQERRLRDVRTDKKNAILFAAEERRRKARSLLNRYGQGYVEREDYGRVRRILQSVDLGEPIAKGDLAWLGSDGREYWTDELREAHHRLLAERYAEQWRQTSDPWAAVNASGNWRKADAAAEALSITQAALERAASGKVRSALCTTRGGALRDSGRYGEAVTLGLEAHALTPSDYRPSTLLGAVHIQMGAYAEGAEWYEKAEALGASRRQIDRELQSILAAVAPKERRELAAFLKSYDPSRYRWVRQK